MGVRARKCEFGGRFVGGKKNLVLLTWDFEVEAAGAAHRGQRGRLSLPGDALLDASLSSHLDCEGTSCNSININVNESCLITSSHYEKKLIPVCTWDVLLCEFDVDVVVSGFGGTIGHSACPVLHILTVDVYFARTLNGQRQASVA